MEEPSQQAEKIMGPSLFAIIYREVSVWEALTGAIEEKKVGRRRKTVLCWRMNPARNSLVLWAKIRKHSRPFLLKR